MTIDEASERYHIPLEILHEYERWGLCGAVKKVMGSWQYDDTDLERLSMIMTLRDIGFENTEIETYMKLLLEQEGVEVRLTEKGWIISATISVKIKKLKKQFSRRFLL